MIEAAFLGYTDVVVTCDELAGVDFMSDEYKNNLEAYKKDVFEKVTPIVDILVAGSAVCKASG